MVRWMRKLSGMIPASVRRRYLPVVVGMAASRMVAHRRILSGPVTVAGLFRSTVGLAESARLSFQALQQAGIAVKYMDMGKIFYWHKKINIAFGEEEKGDGSEGGTLLVHLNPPELALAMPFIGREFVRHKRLIGYWAWELQRLPSHWKIGFRLVDEVWTPSNFVAEAVRQETKTPVYVVPHPVLRPRSSGRSRESFGIPRDCFVVLNAFDMRSSAERKNPFAAVQAFRLAFGDRGDVRMVIKVGAAEESPKVIDQLKRAVNGAQNITLMFDTLQTEDQAALIDCVDVVISLHRSEGFGLVLAEAMHLGKPVIATGYSGNLDFMDRTNSVLIGYKLVPIIDPQKIYTQRNQMWADPDAEEAAEWLKRLAGDHDLRAEIGRQARESAQRYFSLDSFKGAINATGLTPPA